MSGQSTEIHSSIYKIHCIRISYRIRHIIYNRNNNNYTWFNAKILYGKKILRKIRAKEKNIDRPNVSQLTAIERISIVREVS
jgi:hypothetical protein